MWTNASSAIGESVSPCAGVAGGSLGRGTVPVRSVLRVRCSGVVVAHPRLLSARAVTGLPAAPGEAYNAAYSLLQDNGGRHRCRQVVAVHASKTQTV